MLNRVSLLSALAVSLIVGFTGCNNITSPKQQPKKDPDNPYCLVLPDVCPSTTTYVRFTGAKPQGELGKTYMPDLEVKMDTSTEFLWWTTSEPAVIAAYPTRGLRPIEVGNAIICVKIVSKLSSAYSLYSMTGPDTSHAGTPNRRVMMPPRNLASTTKLYNHDCAVFSVIDN